MKWPFIVALSIAAFLAAAKGHGRQVRLEREAHGVHHVVFGGDNPPIVQELWRGDRVRFWTIAPIAAALIGVAAYATGAGLGVGLVGVLWGGVVGFAACGALSALRLRAHDADAFAASLPGALGWFAGALAGAAAAVLLARAAAFGAAPAE